MYKARIINSNWSPIELPKLNNLTLDWKKKDNARALNLVFNELFNARIASGLEKLNIFYLDQLIDSNNQCLLLWSEIKIRSEEMTRGRKPKCRQLNQPVLSILLSKITNDKRKKEWILSEEEAPKIETRIEKCSGCEHNRSTVEGNHTTHIKFDEAQDTYYIDLPENEQEFKGLRSLECPEKELILQAELNEKLKEEILAILTRNLNHQQRNTAIILMDPCNIAVMGAAVVQINEKEEVSLEEVSAYTTGWPSFTRAELLAIWIATSSKTEVVVKTDSAVLIMNIESSKHIAIARQWLKQKNSDLLLLIKKAVSIKDN
ncbi:25596_t:CDS:2 [Gigaspora margarita]|uniref:25596_t:CDS:1 n=1 Tax=Gigaspora margarita TaxID=4874 RepID=A0ABN7UC14_GIGMA|nr:25596_t:CDS:2 [Gigaspora margarita]